MLNVPEIKKIYFIGMGGVGMSATAGIAKAMGFEVAGSDGAAVYAPAKDVLDDEKIFYYIGYDAAHAEAAHADLYVISSGEDLNNPEVNFVYEKNLPHVSFAELLGQLAAAKLRI